jgi:hypothetical protein
MPPQRIPLGSITGNRLPGYQLSPYQRGIAIGMRKAGAKYNEIEIDLDISTGALRSTLTKEQLRPKSIT